MRALGRFGAVPGGVFRGLPRHEGGAVIAGGSHCSAAQRLRALGWFADAGWQDLRAVHDSRCPCSEKGPFLARYSRGVSSNGDLRGFSDTWRAHLAKASSFWMHGAQILPRSPPFSSEAPFWIHGVKKLPRIAARERIRAQSCHRQAPGNAFHGHFAISERPQRHSAMCLNVLRRSPIDARAERPAHALRARRSCPRAARRSVTTPCAATSRHRASRHHAPYVALLSPLKK